MKEDNICFNFYLKSTYWLSQWSCDFVATYVNIHLSSFRIFKRDQTLWSFENNYYPSVILSIFKFSWIRKSKWHTVILKLCHSCTLQFDHDAWNYFSCILMVLNMVCIIDLYGHHQIWTVCLVVKLSQL